MKQLNGMLNSAAAGLITIFFASSAFAGVVPLENRLPAWEDYGTKTIDFTDIKVKARTKRGHGAKRKHGSDTILKAMSTGRTELSLFSPTDGFFGDEFDGEFFLKARIDSNGNLKDGGTFAFYSNDAMFGSDDDNTMKYGCNRKGRHCSTGQLVFGGDLKDFGWSGSEGILEFVTGNLLGWAMDNWQPDEEFGARSEHIYMDVGAFNLKDVRNMKSFNLKADGFAVVPVPAAAFLFGSGLLALIGFSKRKRV